MLDTAEQKKQFRTDPAKFKEYRKAIETDMNSGFAHVRTPGAPDIVPVTHPKQSLKDSSEQTQTVEFIKEMMKQRLGSQCDQLEGKLIPKKFGFGCRFVSCGH